MISSDIYTMLFSNLKLDSSKKIVVKEFIAANTKKPLSSTEELMAQQALTNTLSSLHRLSFVDMTKYNNKYEYYLTDDGIKFLQNITSNDYERLGMLTDFIKDKLQYNNIQKYNSVLDLIETRIKRDFNGYQITEEARKRINEKISKAKPREKANRVQSIVPNKTIKVETPKTDSNLLSVVIGGKRIEGNEAIIKMALQYVLNTNS